MKPPARSEILRLLGVKGEDLSLLPMVDQCLAELEQMAVPRSCTLRLPLTFFPGGVKVGGTAALGESLRAHLQGCEEAVLMTATLGAQVDRQAMRLSRTDIARAAVWQAAAAAMIEQYCDDVCEEIGKQVRTEGLYLRPRYSPGYGDFSLSAQRDILNVLQASKRIGLTLTGGGMLTPTKSVTAVIGLTRQEQGCAVHRCADCDDTDCPFRREGA